LAAWRAWAQRHVSGPANLTPALREVGINKTWGAVYNPPGYAFNFKPTRARSSVILSRSRSLPPAAGWKKDEIAFWVTADDPVGIIRGSMTSSTSHPKFSPRFRVICSSKG